MSWQIQDDKDWCMGGTRLTAPRFLNTAWPGNSFELPGHAQRLTGESSFAGIIGASKWDRSSSPQ